METNKKQSFSALRVIASVFANLTAILSANYIVFFILDHFNPGLRFVVHTDFFLTKYLHIVIPVLLLLTALLYLLIYAGGGWKPRRLRKKKLIAILIVDILLAGLLAMTVNARAFGWVKWLRPAEMAPVAVATLPPEPTAAPTEPATNKQEDIVAPETPQTNANETAEAQQPTSDPTEAPTPEPTPMPGLLGDKYKEKFSEGEPIVAEPNTSETLADGTVRTLIYRYAGQKIAIELYRYRNAKQEYQIAEVYVREIEKLTAAYEVNQNNTKYVSEFAQSCNARVAISSDYFSNNTTDEGLVIRNGILIRNKECKHNDLCVIYQDGTMRCFDVKKDRIDNNEIIASYPYHSFYFGPSLLDENGSAKTKFNSTLGGKNPRTVLGYYEPGHYAFISVLGDYEQKTVYNSQKGRMEKDPDLKAPKYEGITLAELSELCASLGLKAAYNLDGGRSIGMYWNNKMFGHNYRTIGDILAVID